MIAVECSTHSDNKDTTRRFICSVAFAKCFRYVFVFNWLSLFTSCIFVSPTKVLVFVECTRMLIMSMSKWPIWASWGYAWRNMFNWTASKVWWRLLFQVSEIPGRFPVRNQHVIVETLSLWLWRSQSSNARLIISSYVFSSIKKIPGVF